MAKKAKSHKVCARCERRQVIAEYYTARSNATLFPDERVPVCKNCINEVVEKDGFEGFQAVLKLLNKPLLENIYKGDHRDYLRQIQSLPQYFQQTYEDSDLFSEVKLKTSEREIVLTELTEEELADAIYFWGDNYTEEDYIYLLEEYFSYESSYEITDKAMETLVKEMCLTQLDIRKAREQGKDTAKLIASFEKLMGAASLKPVQETGASGSEHRTFGEFIEGVENKRPIPQAEGKLKDVDNLAKYIRVWFAGFMNKSRGFPHSAPQEFEEEVGKYTVTPTDSKGDNK